MSVNAPGSNVSFAAIGGVVAAPSYQVLAQNDGATALQWAKQVTGLAPSPTANTYGTSTTWVGDTAAIGILLAAVAIASTGTFGSETLTVQIEASYSDGTNHFVTKTFTAAGTTTTLSPVDLYTLAHDGGMLTSLTVSCESTIASSAATATVTAVGFNAV
jgi:hypothetical protein